MIAKRVPNDQPSFYFRKREPVRLWAAAGDLLEFETGDAIYATLTGRDIDDGTIDFMRANALTGPVGIEGAKPGDALGIEIVSIEVGSRAFAVYVARWRTGSFGLPESRVVEVAIRDGFVVLPGRGRVVVEPMVGCIGVAPSTGAVSSLSPASPTGGNMDLVELRPGATIWLPVQVPGALLSIGDLHARMGRGEPLGSGLECAGQVIVKTMLASGKSIPGPVVCDGVNVAFVGTDPRDSDVAEQIAVRTAWEWLTIDCRVAEPDALAMCASLLDLAFGGPAGANVLARFRLSDLRAAGVDVDRWPVVTSAVDR